MSLLTTSQSAVWARAGKRRLRLKAIFKSHWWVCHVVGRHPDLAYRLFFLDMSSYEGHLSPLKIWTTKMSFPSSSPAANPFLVDSLIGACRTDSFYSNSNMYMPSGSEMGTYGMQTCGLLPSFGKRGEVNHQNSGMNVHSYIPQIDNWTNPSRPCRIEPHSQMSNCTFSQSIKEENNCCMYSDKRVQKVSSPEVPAYSNAVAEPCPVEGPEIPVPGYFRLSETYSNAKHPEHYCHEPPSPNPTLMQLSRVTPKPQPPPSKFAEAEKKIQDVSQNPDTARTPVPAESPGSKSTSEEKICSVETPASSPELLQKEGKGGSTTMKAFIMCRCAVKAPAS